MFMDKIHGLEDMIINVSSLLNLIYKSDAIQMKIPVKFFFCGTWWDYSYINLED